MVLDDFFPPCTRVLYGRAQLRQVICQLRFPPILRIDGQPPADFQDQIRDIFPLFESATNPVMQQLPHEVAQLLGGTGSVNYQFRTEDGRNMLSLTRDAIALTSTAYARWEIFRTLLHTPLDALLSIYKPGFFQRVGLRYQNVISRRELGLSERPWSTMFRTEMLGELSIPEWEADLADAKRVIRVLARDKSEGFLLQHGLATSPTSEQCYSIDFDFYRDQRTEVHDARPILDRFHHLARRAFRWGITDALHDAMAPAGLEEGDSI